MKAIFNACVVVATCYLVGRVACFHTNLDQFVLGWWSSLFALVGAVLHFIHDIKKGGKNED